MIPLTPALAKAIASDACLLMEMGCEPTSAIKQAAADRGVSYGPQMGSVVKAVAAILGL